MTTAQPVIIWEFQCEECGDTVWACHEDFDAGTATIECISCGGISMVVMEEGHESVISMLEH